MIDEFTCRSKILAKCKDLKSKGKIKDVATKNGDIIVLVEVKRKAADADDEGVSGVSAGVDDVNGVNKAKEVGEERPPEEPRQAESQFSPTLASESDSPTTVFEKLVVVTDTQFENLLKITKGIGDEDVVADKVSHVD